MKIRYNDEMKKNILTYSAVVVIGIITYFVLNNYSPIKEGIGKVFHVLFPFIFGFAFAFLLNKPMMWIENKILGKVNMNKDVKHKLAAVFAVILGILVVGGFIWLIVPQILESSMTLVEKFPDYMQDFEVFVNKQMKKYDVDFDLLYQYIGTEEDFFNQITEIVTNALPKVVSSVYQVFMTLFDVVLGIMAGLYILLDKDKFNRYVKKINYAVFSKDVADYLYNTSIKADNVFNDFIVGKAIDSLIIGLLCYVGMSVLGFPYAVLLSFIVGVTNMIPVFGPFIGAIPGVFILFIIHPIDAVYFALFILALQQFDGNILGPLILGDKLGLPSLFILFSVCIGADLFGVIGMFLGVPIFTLIYMAVREFVNYKLDKKNIEIE